MSRILVLVPVMCLFACGDGMTEPPVDPPVLISVGTTEKVRHLLTDRFVDKIVGKLDPDLESSIGELFSTAASAAVERDVGAVTDAVTDIQAEVSHALQVVVDFGDRVILSLLDIVLADVERLILEDKSGSSRIVQLNLDDPEGIFDHDTTVNIQRRDLP